MRRARRGVRELDGLLIPFSERLSREGSEPVIADFEQLLEQPDPLLLDWFFGRSRPHDPALARLVDEILAFRPQG